jgi:transposase
MAFSGRLSDAQWARIAPHLPRGKGTSRRGRPPADPRTYFEGILWILWTGAPWRALPRKYGSSTTCWRRLRQWDEDGTLLAPWRALLADLNDAEKVRWDECFGHGSFAPAKGRRRSRQDQERQGHKVDASGRWRGYSAGSTPGLGQSERDEAPRNDDRRRPGEACASAAAAAVEAGSTGAGPRL